tara:strand:- start:2099 stop:2329 length:231 start_codon:yes stop_codon:yes gene_type:complete
MVEYYEEQLEELEVKEDDLLNLIHLAFTTGQDYEAERLEETLEDVLAQMKVIEDRIVRCMVEPLDFSEDEDTESLD